MLSPTFARGVRAFLPSSAALSMALATGLVTASACGDSSGVADIGAAGNDSGGAAGDASEPTGGTKASGGSQNQNGAGEANAGGEPNGGVAQATTRNARWPTLQYSTRSYNRWGGAAGPTAWRRLSGRASEVD